MRSKFTPWLLILVCVLLLWLYAQYMTPALFLFVAAIMLMLLHYFSTSIVQRKWNIHESTTSNESAEKNFQEFKKKRPFRVIGLICLWSLFLVSAFTLHKYQTPSDKNPYFNNTNHYAIRNSGIAFTGSLVLENEDPKQSGIWESDAGLFKIRTDDRKNIWFQFENYFQPVFFEPEKKVYTAINNIFPSPLVSGYNIQEGRGKLTFKKIQTVKERSRTVYKLDLHMDYTPVGSSIPVSEDIHIDKTINKIISIKDLIERDTSSSTNQIIRGLLYQWLDKAGNIFLVNNVDSNGARYLTLFPGADAIYRGYKIYNEDAYIAPKMRTNIPVADQQTFYIGIDRSREYKIQQLDENETKAINREYVLYFSQAKYYSLRNKEEKEELGTPQLRFLKNKFIQLSQSDFREGYLFNNNVVSKPDNYVNAMMQYSLQRSGLPIDLNISDFNSKDKVPVFDNKFALASQGGKSMWIFELRDFNNNGFQYSYLICYLAAITLLVSLLIVFYPSQKLVLLEVPLWILFITLISFRLLLFWRVATFPPLENISRNELSRILNFDFRLLGIEWPIPLTVVFSLLFVLLVLLFRIIKTGKTGLLLVKLPAKNMKNWQFFFLHFVVLSACFVVFILINEEIVKRVTSIILPVTSWILFTSLTIKNGIKFNYSGPAPKYKPIAYLQAFGRYWIESPNFFTSLITLCFLVFLDTGFAVLFLLFLILQSVVFSFSRIKLQKIPGTSILNPSRYWIYGYLFLIIYLGFIGYKPLFHKMLLHTEAVIICGIVLLMLFSYLLIEKRKIRLGMLSLSALLLVLFALPYTKNIVLNKVENKIRNTVYRTSVIYQNIENLIYQHGYQTSKERKIVETAQNQWFINSYIHKRYDFDKPINLQPHFNKGVDYITQTRDVVIPRYVIAEFGNPVMVSILFLFITPLILYFVTYKTSKKQDGVLSYEGIMASKSFLFLITLCVFVWLTSTNRFVFFGQDFPFFSLTSRTSLILPIILFIYILTDSPIPRYESATYTRNQSNTLRLQFIRWASVLFCITGVVLISGSSKKLSEKNFNIDLTNTQKKIDEDLNQIFFAIQDADNVDLTAQSQLRAFKRNTNELPKDLTRLLTKLINNPAFAALYANSNVYEQSLFDIIKKDPKKLLTIQSPLQIKFDENHYELLYNSYTFFELPPYEQKTSWVGSIYEANDASAKAIPLLKINDKTYKEARLPFATSCNNGNIELSLIPGSWLKDTSSPLCLLNISRSKKTEISIFKGDDKVNVKQNLEGFVNVIKPTDLAFIRDETNFYTVTFREENNAAFGLNFWVNGRQRMVYPLGKDFFWAYHYAQVCELNHRKAKNYRADEYVTLDLELTKVVSNITKSYARSPLSEDPDFNFSVVGIDGTGAVRLMADYAKRRNILDPNDFESIDALKREQFFFSDIKKERLQWGNLNLLRMNYGPGSSIKPLIAAAVSSQVNAGWGDIVMQGSNKFTNGAVHQYAGLSLGKKGWKQEHKDNKITDFVQYLRESSNFYNSLLLFLGSYPREAFRMPNAPETFSIQNVLTTIPDDSLCYYPSLRVGDGPVSYFHSIRQLPESSSNGWPKSGLDANHYFGNPTSLLSNGVATNLGIKTQADLKTKNMVTRCNFAGPSFDSAFHTGFESILWSFPEESYFLQEKRTSPNRFDNFYCGLKNPAHGGAPYEITPLRMAEAYARMALQNNNLSAHVNASVQNEPQDWNIDELTWKGGFPDFLSKHVFKGMKGVLSEPGGTALGFLGSNYQYKGYYLFAKTGTIDENTEKSSKRFTLVISNEDLSENVSKDAHVYVLYFSAQKIGSDQDWNTMKLILDAVMNSLSFKVYMANAPSHAK